jgi:serine/threonine-protein kinase
MLSSSGFRRRGVDAPASLVEAVSDRYGLVRRVGQGGTATVYLAEDRKLGRYVALKVLDPALSAGVSAEWFAREVRLLARLNHPNVLTLHDSGTSGGWLWYTTPFVAGESLRARIAREHRLPIAEAVELATQVADGLAHAHGFGIVHRDVKPENVLLDSGRALVADFGISKVLATEQDALHTATGMVVGTPRYMSPEQAGGQRAVDARSDVYALGVMLYEMLVGDVPFNAPTPVDVLFKHLHEPPPPPRLRAADIPEGLEAMVLRALSKAPGDRFADAGALADALRSETGLEVRPRPAQQERLLVLDFTPLSSEGEAVSLAGGFLNTLRAELARTSGGRVLPREVSDKLGRGLCARTTDSELLSLARAAGARWAVWGTVQLSGGAVRVVLRLADTVTGQVHESRHDGSAANVFLVQDQVATRVTELARLTPPVSAPSLTEHAPAQISAHAHFSQAEQALQRFGPAGFAEARREYEAALAADSGHVLARVGLGKLLGLRFNMTSRVDDLNESIDHLERACALAPELGEAHWALGYAYMRRGRHEEAERSALRATALEPENGMAFHILGASRLLLALERHRWECLAPALAAELRATELLPRAVFTRFAISEIYRLTGLYDEARLVAEQGWALEQAQSPGLMRFVGTFSILGVVIARGDDPRRAEEVLRQAVAHYEADEHAYAVNSVAQALAELGRVAEDRGAIDEALGHYRYGAALCEARRERAGTGWHLVRARLGLSRCLSALGRADEARSELARAVERYARREGAFSWQPGGCDAEVRYDLARTHAASGRVADAVQALREAVEAAWGEVPLLRRDPSMASLQGHPEVEALVRLVESRGRLPPLPAWFLARPQPTVGGTLPV